MDQMEIHPEYQHLTMTAAADIGVADETGGLKFVEEIEGNHHDSFYIPAGYWRRRRD